MVYISKRNRRKEKDKEIAATNRRELIAAGFKRRDLLKMGLLTSAGMLIPKKGLSAHPLNTRGSFDDDEPNSPDTTPWQDEMPRLPVLQPVAALNPAPQKLPNTGAGEARTVAHQAWDDFPPLKYYEMSQHLAYLRVAPEGELPLQPLWTFNGTTPGPLIVERYGVLGQPESGWPIAKATPSQKLVPVGRYLAPNPWGKRPLGLAFAGNSIWVANSFSNSVTRLSTTGAVLGTYAVGRGPFGIAAQGDSVWVTNFFGKRHQAADRGWLHLGTFNTGDGASGIVFDGTFIWVVNNGDSTVVKMTPENGAIITTYATGKGPFAVVFDGSKIWVSNFASDSVSTTAAN